MDTFLRFNDALAHQSVGWQYNFQKEEKIKVGKDCGYEMERKNLANFNVSFEANGGSGSMTSVSVLEGTEFTFPANGFTAPDGNLFTGWLLDGRLWKPGDKITPVGDLRLSAQWIPENQHSHVYDSGYETDASYHWRKCVCGAADRPTAHEFGSWNITKEPSASVAGEKEDT